MPNTPTAESREVREPRDATAVPMMQAIRTGRADVASVVALLGTAATLASPVILGGGITTYMDNPVHLAELAELAEGGTGWSDLGFTGMPITTLHSPVWYPLLAGAVRMGVPLLPLYLFAVFAGFVAPALAVYGVLRRRSSPTAALALAYLLLVQAPSLRSVGSPLAGMWTHAFAAAGVIVLAELLARRELPPRGHFLVSLLLAGVALTHLFGLVACVILFLITALLREDGDRLAPQENRRRLTAAGVAAVASAAYWLTFLLTVRSNEAPQDVLDLPSLACRLLLPCEVLYLLDGMMDKAIRRELWLTDAVPMIALVVLAALSARAAVSRHDRLARTGRWLAVVLLVALVVHPFLKMAWLGPVSWRQLEWVRVGCVFAAAPLVGSWMGAGLRLRGHAALGLALAVSGLWWSRPLAGDRPASTHEEWQELREAWDFLREHRDPAWGRVYVLDTFGGAWEQGGLSHSHVLALTHRESGVRQLGPYYGVVPFRTRWTLSEFNRLFNSRAVSLDSLLLHLHKTNAGALMTSTKRGADWIEDTGKFDRLHRRGRYAVYRVRDARNEWIAPLRPTNHLREVTWEDGRIRFTVDAELPRARLVMKTTWHPWWRLEGIPGATIVETPDGFLGIIDIPPGSHRVRLDYVPSPWPWWISSLGFTLLAGWGIRLRLDRRRPARSQST